MNQDNLLKSENDFFWYMKSIDLYFKTLHCHEGKPSKYPCKVFTDYDEFQGKSTAVHKFIYQQEVECSECQSKRLVWPEVDLE